MNYQNIVLPEGMDSYPLVINGFNLGESSNTSGLNEFGDLLLKLIPIPLLLAVIFFSMQRTNKHSIK